MGVGIGQSGGPCSNDGALIAQNGDVVTTNKWNQLACQVRDVWYELSDGMRGATYFIRGHNDPSGVGGKPGYIVDEINLPTVSGIAPGYGGAINFKNSTKSYNDASGFGGGILYGLTNSTALDFLGFANGVRITTGNTGSYKAYTVGWEKVNALDTADFDTSCQYRATTDGGWKLNFSGVSTRKLIAQFNTSDTNMDTTSTFYTVVLASNAKNVISSAANGSSVVTLLEKFCLPSYNSNNY